ncbi:hypothetical protein KsCSTR_10000 [Candidatus Kuenenia stuttgartiensis]|uniref:Uncharacterized protein n=1 Tax=Kuenenia stuttgartiensis TaxID=174633 RepID=Q1PYU6_KUEST|nr:hypothetical protein KsCSTR_10000 [Candidatus Kuenenia stuttgartiensis]CAJ72257.1 unknown protein [Candidatus Kuenenia stuttgartiensis]
MGTQWHWKLYLRVQICNRSAKLTTNHSYSSWLIVIWLMAISTQGHPFVIASASVCHRKHIRLSLRGSFPKQSHKPS